jgi:hypothetical protein
VVFPTPRGPQNKYACAKWLLFIAFLSVVVNPVCPTTELKVDGRYFLADTMKFSMNDVLLFFFANIIILNYLFMSEKIIIDKNLL